MKTIGQLLLLVTVLFCSASVYSQTVDEIISKHLDAVGGKEKLTWSHFSAHGRNCRSNGSQAAQPKQRF